MRIGSAPSTRLSERLDALAVALDLADGRLAVDAVEAGRVLVTRAADRLRTAPDATVAALAGATGSGKSSLFNALVGIDLAVVGVRRPTTSEPVAAIWGEPDVGPLLDRLEVPGRHLVGGQHREGRHLDGLVLIDLPDHDSTEVAHRVTVDRLVAQVDLLVWVLDPQKYADAAVHDRYLHPLRSHREVMLVVLNQVDRLTPDGLDDCLADLRHLLGADGLAGVAVLAASARSGAGLDALQTALADRVADKRAAVQRLSADVDVAVSRLAAGCGEQGRRRRLDRRTEDVVDALAAAASVDLVTSAVGRSHRRAAAGATGWPFTRWVRRLRPDPLRRLHLARPEDPDGRTSLPPPSPVARGQVDGAIRRLTDEAAVGLAPPWPALVRHAATSRSELLIDALDPAVASTDLGGVGRPRWWAGIGAVQWLLAVGAVAGGVWLVTLVGLAWLRLPDPPLPSVGQVPVPTILLVGGLFLGLVVAWVSRRLATVGARRRQRLARNRLHRSIAEVVDTKLVAAIEAELDAHTRLCQALQRAGG